MPYLNCSLTTQNGTSLNVGVDVSEESAAGLQNFLQTFMAEQLAIKLGNPPAATPTPDEPADPASGGTEASTDPDNA